MSLKGKKIAIFLENIFEDVEFWYPYYRMKEAEAEVTVIAPSKNEYEGKNGTTAKSDLSIDEAKPDDYDGLIIPGGYSPDQMRRVPAMVEFVSKMNINNKTIAAICHAGWMLASAGILNGRKVTSFYSIKDDLVHAGAVWSDNEVVIDENIVTSRNPNDLPVFCKTIIESLNKA